MLHKGSKKALLIGVQHVRGMHPLAFSHRDTKEFRELLICRYGYAEDDIVMLLDNPGLHRSSWPSRRNVMRWINWLVKGVGKHDMLVFYYSGHGGETIEKDGKHQFIHTYTGHQIMDNVLKQHLVDPVLKTKGCHLFALFDCSYSQNILYLEHNNCFGRKPRLDESSIIFSHTSSVDVPQIRVANEHVQVVSGGQPLSISTALVSPSNSIMLPHLTVMSESPISDHICFPTTKEENKGHVVSLGASVTFDDNETGATLTKFFLSSLVQDGSISYRGLLDDIEHQVTGLHAMVAASNEECYRSAKGPSLRRQNEVTSENSQEWHSYRNDAVIVRISSNRPLESFLDAMPIKLDVHHEWEEQDDATTPLPSDSQHDDIYQDFFHSSDPHHYSSRSSQPPNVFSLRRLWKIITPSRYTSLVSESVPLQEHPQRRFFSRHIRPRPVTIFPAQKKQFYVNARQQLRRVVSKDKRHSKDKATSNPAPAGQSSANQPQSAPPVSQQLPSKPVTQPAEVPSDYGCWTKFWFALCCVPLPVQRAAS